jgi:hypothetical protein
MTKSMIFSKTTFAKLLSLFVIVMVLVAPISVNAARMVCRSDPIVFLSDGTRLQFNAVVETAKENVTSIRYVVHVPAGVSADRVVFTPNWARDVETVELVNDQAPGNYLIVANVNTGSETVAVQINASMVAQSNGGQGSTHQVVTGLSGQAIVVQFAAQ